MEEESGFKGNQGFRLHRIVTFFAEARFTSTNPTLKEPQTVKYYLHPSDSDGCRLLLNSFFCPENEHFVEVKCVLCLKQRRAGN